MVTELHTSQLKDRHGEAARPLEPHVLRLPAPNEFVPYRRVKTEEPGLHGSRQSGRSGDVITVLLERALNISVEKVYIGSMFAALPPR